MNTPQIFNFENNLFQLEVKTENGESLFDVETVAKSLGISRIATSGNEVVRWERVNKYLGSAYPQVGTGDFIPEPMVYKLAFKANNALAEKFQDWLAVEVLPTIRKQGAYLTDQKAYDITHNPDSLADLLLQAGEQLKQKDLIIQEMEPKALFSDAVRGSVNSCLVTELATILKQNGVNIGQNRLFDWLRDNGYLCREGRRKNHPTQRSMDLGIMDVREHIRTNSQGELVSKFTPLVTGKGQQYFVNKFLTTETA